MSQTKAAREAAIRLNHFLHEAGLEEIGFFYSFLSGKACTKLREMFHRWEGQEYD